MGADLGCSLLGSHPLLPQPSQATQEKEFTYTIEMEG